MPPPGWFADPLRRHEFRYWDGASWTEHVSDAGRGSVDPPTSPVAPAVQGPSPYAATAAAQGPKPSAAAPAVGGYGTPPPVAYAYGPPRDATAVMGRRYGAFFIDLAITLVVFTALFFPFAQRHSLAEMERVPGCHRTSANMIQCDNRQVVTVGDTVYEARSGGLFLAEVAFTFLYFGVLTGLTGFTLGKAATGIRVVRADGSVVGVGRSLLRWILWLVDGPLTLFLCGIITSATSRGHRRLGDMAAQSYVVGKDDAGRPINV
jgi:uncharacterized RDD family membrane protein YckC